MFLVFPMFLCLLWDWRCLVRAFWPLGSSDGRFFCPAVAQWRAVSQTAKKWRPVIYRAIEGVTSCCQGRCWDWETGRPFFTAEEALAPYRLSTCCRLVFMLILWLTWWEYENWCDPWCVVDSGKPFALFTSVTKNNVAPSLLYENVVVFVVACIIQVNIYKK